MEKVTAIFDIGKTNKKFFLFDAYYKEMFREYIILDTVEDEEGHPTEDLNALEDWIRDTIARTLKSVKYDITAINFSTYGASLVHIDENGKLVAPLYNYTKPLDSKFTDSFFKKFGPEDTFSIATGTSYDGMLNSGMQLYWLKYDKPELFKKIKYSLHLPQYISYLFTGIPLSEYTSIGCHTAMWDFSKNDYHDWIYKEELNRILPPIVSTEKSFDINLDGKRIKIGVGIHDSSAALLPYMASIRDQFILLSTGTWSIALNPFSDKLLSKKEIANSCINYMGINGKPVKSARLFLGNEYNIQVKKLSEQFDLSHDYHEVVKFDSNIFLEISRDLEPTSKWEDTTTSCVLQERTISYNSFEHAYHHLMVELVMLQVEKIKAVAGLERIEKIYIDGGFSNNDVYVKLLGHYLHSMEIYTANSSLGSALGAAIVLSNEKLNENFLKENYRLKKQAPIILK